MSKVVEESECTLVLQEGLDFIIQAEGTVDFQKWLAIDI
jgi:hypothetical protein